MISLRSWFPNLSEHENHLGIFWKFQIPGHILNKLNHSLWACMLGNFGLGIKKKERENCLEQIELTWDGFVYITFVFSWLFTSLFLSDAEWHDETVSGPLTKIEFYSVVLLHRHFASCYIVEVGAWGGNGKIVFQRLYSWVYKFPLISPMESCLIAIYSKQPNIFV